MVVATLPMQLWKRNLYILWSGCFITMIGSSLVIPFLPLYIEQLGVKEVARIAHWSGLVFSASFMLSAIVSPMWGRMADKHGRKLMLLRASLGMAVIMTLMGLVQNVYQLFFLRLLMGLVSGYIPAAITMVATQVPKEHSGWALGTLSTGSVAGTLIGPVIGGTLAEIIGLHHVFFVTGGFMLLSFLVSLLFVREEFVKPSTTVLTNQEVFKLIKYPKLLAAMFLTTFMIQFANMSIEPIVTIYVKQLAQNMGHIALVSGAVVSVAGLANIIAAPRLGRLSDRYGARKILLVCLFLAALVFIPQAFVQNLWQLMGLRFLLGLTMAGMLPAVNSLIKRSVPQSVSGRVFGYNQSAQFLGNIAGPNLGGQMAAHFGIRYVFLSTSALIFINAGWVYITGKSLAGNADKRTSNFG